MPRTHLPYPPELRYQMVERARSGRAIRELAREFGCSDRTIRNRVRQSDLDEGRHDDGLTSAERETRGARNFDANVLRKMMRRKFDYFKRPFEIVKRGCGALQSTDSRTPSAARAGGIALGARSSGP